MQARPKVMRCGTFKQHALHLIFVDAASSAMLTGVQAYHLCHTHRHTSPSCCVLSSTMSPSPSVCALNIAQEVLTAQVSNRNSLLQPFKSGAFVNAHNFTIGAFAVQRVLKLQAAQVQQDAELQAAHARGHSYKTHMQLMQEQLMLTEERAFEAEQRARAEEAARTAAESERDAATDAAREWVR